MIARMLRAGMAAGVMAIGTAGTAVADPTPVDTFQPAMAVDAGLYQNDPLQSVPTSIFKVGNSAFQAQAKYAFLPAVDMGQATVTRTADEVVIDVGHHHVSIERDPKNASLVLINWKDKGVYEARTSQHDGTFEADTVDGKLTLGLTPLPDGRIRADAAGIVPGTAHLFLTPITG
ncbi:MAG TPA: hypothetical protein VGO93_15820 [Candidatus Xenobia bacterium]|jgi:hypothetical protein